MLVQDIVAIRDPLERLLAVGHEMHRQRQRTRILTQLRDRTLPDAADLGIMSLREMADLLGITHGTIRTILWRERRKRRAAAATARDD